LALTPGTRLGVYEITAPIGEGGMGQVYRATDTTLGRQVAIKILSDAFAADPEQLARFEREAKTLASLNHPHIAAIYAVEKSDGTLALIMELVEGDALSQRIARGAIPLDEALPIAKQIAEALEAAHEQGIIHRDLKPANVKVRPDGTVKVLDFGLAKAMEPASGVLPSMSMSPTITTPAMTQAGAILGTAAYMSPEQARGKTVDERADIWAFGVVLHEMLTGQRLFTGDGISDTLAAVLKTAPDWRWLPASTPAGLRRLLHRCLEKDPRRRLQAIGEARVQIEDLVSGAPEPAGVVALALPPLVWSRTLTWMFAASTLALASAVMVWSPWRAEKPADRPLVLLDVDLGADVSLPAPARGGIDVAISPDGSRLVYGSGPPTKLFTRRLDQPNATELPGTQGASRPFFSPDGQWVGFVVGTGVHKISVEGGATVPIGNVPNFAGASWDEDGSIIVSDTSKGLVRIPAGGGTPETIAGLGNGERALALPQVLPGSKAILFAADSSLGVDQITIEVLTLADRRRKIVARSGQSPRYLPTSNGAGHLVYINTGTVFAIPFDLKTLETRGTAVPVLNNVAYNAQVGSGEFDVSRTGTVVYRKPSGRASATMTVQWVDPTGREPLRAKAGVYANPCLSPDGKRIALSVTQGVSADVWIYDSERETMTRLTFGGAFYRSPIWSPDGQYVLFSRFGMGIFQARADGASQPQALTRTKTNQIPRSFTPDGKRLAYVEIAGNIQIWTVPLEDQGGQLKAGAPEPFLKSSFVDQSPSFSPDGQWLAYQSTESGKNEVYVRAFRPPSSRQGGKWQISNNGGTGPRWSRGGHELVYQSGDQIMTASYTVNGDTFVAEKPRVWIAKLGAAVVANATGWDLAPDGKRVAVLTPVESADAPKQEHEVVFLLNFFDELRRRVPLGK
jgi:Tol biopolymer transport system component